MAPAANKRRKGRIFAETPKKKQMSSNVAGGAVTSRPAEPFSYQSMKAPLVRSEVRS